MNEWMNEWMNEQIRYNKQIKLWWKNKFLKNSWIFWNNCNY